MYIEIIVSAIIGYLLGSIPFALVIGLVFYKTDVRQHGSKNLGGANTGRVLGKKAGVAVMVCDILKVTLAILITSCFKQKEVTTVIAGLFAAVGHCFPLFANFKGGKAVATMYGFLFGMALFGGQGLLFFILPLATYVVILYFTKIVSLTSMIVPVLMTIYAFIVTDSLILVFALGVFSVLIIVRHRKNIQRMIKGEENKISWM